MVLNCLSPSVLDQPASYQLSFQVLGKMQDYRRVDEIARMLGCSKKSVLRKCQTLGWRVIHRGARVMVNLDDVRTYIAKFQRVPPGFISTADARQVLGINLSSLYILARSKRWGRFLTNSRDLYLWEADVLQYAASRPRRLRSQVPEPSEPPWFAKTPEGYLSAEEIAHRYGQRVGLVYQLASRHHWQKVRVGSRKVRFWIEDVKAYYEPETARSYSLEEAAALWDISPLRCVLVARLGGWRKLRGSDRFYAADVERSQPHRQAERFIDAEEAARHAGVPVNILKREAASQKWLTVQVKLGYLRAIFYRWEDIERFIAERADRREDAYYSATEIRQTLRVSRQRVSQLARRWRWRVVSENRRSVRYLKADVDHYFTQRGKFPPSEVQNQPCWQTVAGKV